MCIGPYIGLLPEVMEMIVADLWIKPYIRDKIHPFQFAYVSRPGTICAVAHRIVEFLEVLKNVTKKYNMS